MFTAAKRIEELRKEGWVVKVRIERALEIKTVDGITYVTKSVSRGDENFESGEKFLPRGGRTIVQLKPPDATEFVEGSTICHPVLDNFNNKIGLEAAFGRAWKQYTGNGEEAEKP